MSSENIKFSAAEIPLIYISCDNFRELYILKSSEHHQVRASAAPSLSTNKYQTVSNKSWLGFVRIVSHYCIQVSSLGIYNDKLGGTYITEHTRHHSQHSANITLFRHHTVQTWNNKVNRSLHNLLESFYKVIGQCGQLLEERVTQYLAGT